MAEMHNIKSFLLEIEQGQTEGYVTWQPANSIQVYMLKIIPFNLVFGDTGCLEFLDDNDQVIAQFCDGGVHLNPNGCTIDFPSDDMVNIITPTKVKLKINAVDSNGRKLIFWLQYKQ